MKKLTGKSRKWLITSGIMAGFLICIIVLFSIYTPNISDFVSGLTNGTHLIKSESSPETDKSENETVNGNNESNISNQTNTSVNNTNTVGATENNAGGQALTNTSVESNPTGLLYNNPGGNIVSITEINKVILNAGSHRVIIDGIEDYPGFQSGSFADIRIRFQNGEEYTVLEKTCLYLYKNEEGKIKIYVDLSETELLYISSACYDQSKYSGVRMYLAACLEEVDTASQLGNYRPSKDILTLINEEKLMDAAKADELYLARERLENRLILYSDDLIKEVEDDLLEGGLLGETTDGYWIYN